MTITQIHAFFSIATSKTYTEAAERLQFSPSVLSKTVNSLEQELGVTLFRKGRNNLYLTEAGQWLYPHMQYILSQYTAMEHLSTNLRVVKQSVRIDIGCMFFSDYYNLVELVSDIEQTSPALKINLAEYRSSDLNALLRTYSLTGAFIYREFLQNSYQHILDIKKEPIVALMSKRMAARFPSPIPLTSLADYTFLFLQGDYLVHHFFQRACINVGFVPHEAPMDLRVSTIVELLSSTNMVTLLFQSFAEREIANHEDLVMLPIQGIEPLTLSLVCPHDFPPNGYQVLKSYLQAGFSPFGTLTDSSQGGFAFNK